MMYLEFVYALLIRGYMGKFRYGQAGNMRMMNKL